MKRSFTALMVLFSTLFCAFVCQAQILGTTQLNVARRGHTATLLEDGKILIVGGDNADGVVSQAELVDPSSQTSSLTAGSIVARTDHTASRLADGRVLVVGGRNQNGSLASSEFFHPLTATFTAGPNLSTPRSGHTATLLSDGTILIVGGDANDSAEIYNPATETFLPVVGRLMMARKFHSSILTSSGQVLIAGGVNAQDTMLNSAEIYDPTSQTFYLPPTDMQTARAFAALKILSDGKIQIIGGDAELSMEVFDPITGIFNGKALLPPNIDLLGATLTTQSRAALFSPAISQDPLLQGILTPDQLALLDSADHSITELPSLNQALVAGGINNAGQILNRATFVKSSSASITTDKNDYAPGEIVTITGTNFQPNERVDIYFHEFPEEYPDIFLSVIANQQGSFLAADFAPQEIDLGRVFTLTAIGRSSEFTAQTAFRDSRTITSVTLTANATTVPPGALTVVAGTSISATVNVTTATGGGNANWLATGWRIATAPGNVTCADHANHNGVGSYSETFNVTAPATTGIYNAYFVAYQNDGCTQQPSNTFTLSSVINVVAATSLSVSPATGTYGGTVNLSATLTSGGSPVSGKTISFTLNGGAVGSATTNASGIATLNGASLSGIGAGSYLAGIGANFAGDSSFASSNGTANLTVNQAPSTTTVTCPPSVTYDGSAQTPCSATVTGVGGLNQSLPVTYANNINAGTATASATFAGDANHTGSSDTKTFTIEKAATVTTVTCGAGPFVFNGSPHTPCSASVSGPGSLNQVLTVNYTDNVNAGTATASATYAETANYKGSSDTKTFTIEKAETVTTVTCGAGPFVFNGSPHTPCSASVSGPGGLNQALTVNYTDNVNAGTATASASYAETANYKGSSDTKTFTIEKAGSTTMVSCPASVTYDGTAQTPCSATVTGAGGLNLTPTPSYTNNVNAGTATASYTYAETANHEGSSDSKTFEITKAPVTTTAGSGSAIYDGTTRSPSACMVTGAYTGDLICANNPAVVGPNAGTTTIVPVVSGTGLNNFEITSVNGSYTIEKAASTTLVTCPASVTYNGLAQTPCSVSVTGAGGLNLAPPTNYADNINAGTATASYTFSETVNHLGSTDSKTFVIKKAAVTATAGGGNAIYDGDTKSPSACLVTGAYTGDLTCTNNPAVVGPDAGTATILPVISGTGLDNFDVATINGSYTINQASSITLVMCPTNVTYNGAAQTPCSATVTGAGGLSQSLSINYVNNVDAGTATASAFYPGNTNHIGSNDSKNFTIDKANPICNVNGYSGTYNGAAHGATGSCTGVGGTPLAGLNLGASFTNVPGGTANWTFTDITGNYKDQSGSVAIVINKADATCTVTGFSGPYDGLAHGATGSCTGVGGPSDVLTGLNIAPTTYTYVPGGLVHWTFTNNNYMDLSGDATVTITTAFAYDGFYSPIAGYGGSYNNTVKTFKLGSTIPVKFSGTWLNTGAPLITGIHTLQAVKYSNATDSDPPIDATPTDAATTGNQFRLTDGQWHFNLSTKGNGFSAGAWLLRATLQDGSQHLVWITLKK